MAKIATIKDFSGMEDNGVWYLEGMKVKKIAGKSVLSPFYNNQFTLSEDTSGYTNIGRIVGGDSYINFNDAPDIVGISDSGYIHSWNQLSSGWNLGLLHLVNTSATQPIALGDLKITKKKSIVYATDTYLGIGYFGTVMTGSGTTKIVDTDGRNWTTLGIGTTDGINKVINITTETEYTITSISTTNSTNDTLNFSAGTANAAGELFHVFTDKGANNSAAFWNFFTGAAYPHFTGQKATSTWSRSICQFSSGSTGRFLITNGNYLASLSTDETSWNATYKQLPDNVQGYAVSSNGPNILIGGEKNNAGKLMLWDDFTTGFLSILDLPGVPTSITPYGSGFLFLMGTEIYYTDGYSYKLVCKVMDNDKLGAIANYCSNALKSVGQRIYLNASFGTGQGGMLRDRAGLWIYEMGKGWTIVPFTADSASPSTINPLRNVTGGALIISGIFGLSNTIWSSFSTNTAHANCINKLQEAINYRSEVAFFLPILRPVNIKKVVLGLMPSANTYPAGANDNITVTVTACNSRKSNFRYIQAGTGSTASAIVSTSGNSYFFQGKVGDEIRMLDYSLAGQTSWITSIANAGTITETWTVSPAFSGTPTVGAMISIWPFKKSDTKTLQFHDLADNVEFDIEGVYGESLFLQVIITAPLGYSADLNFIDIHA